MNLSDFKYFLASEIERGSNFVIFFDCHLSLPFPFVNLCELEVNPLRYLFHFQIGPSLIFSEFRLQISDLFWCFDGAKVNVLLLFSQVFKLVITNILFLSFINLGHSLVLKTLIQYYIFRCNIRVLFFCNLKNRICLFFHH